MAAQECSDTSVAISSSTPPLAWWDLHHAPSLSPWSLSTTNNNNNFWHHHPKPSSNSSCEEDVSMSTSFTNASNHSGLTVESSHRLVEPPASSSAELIGVHASDSQLWSQILLGVGSNGELQNSQDVEENLLDALSSKSNGISSGLFEPACDYLKKMDSNWEFSNSPSFNIFDKHINSFSTTSDQNMIQNEGMTRLSNLVSNWSIAPPNPGLINREFDPITCNISLSSSSSSSLSHYSQPQTYSDSSSCDNKSNEFLSCYGHDVKVENDQHRHVEIPGYLLKKSFSNNNGVGYHIGHRNSSVFADNSKYYYGVLPDINSCTNSTNFVDGVGFNGRFNKSLVDVHGHKPFSKSSTLSDYRNQGLQTSSLTARRHGNTTGEGKKKRSEETSEIIQKKPKHESSTVSSVKMQAPKVKIADRITALQQIVSPFGKTDTSSVLLEAIQYIKFLQEQVQLLSNPYMKNNTHKDPWGSLDKKDKGEVVEVDLRSRGLCLVPISCTPQVYHENTGSDFWTPTYRSGCLYR